MIRGVSWAGLAWAGLGSLSAEKGAAKVSRQCRRMSRVQPEVSRLSLPAALQQERDPCFVSAGERLH